jgi:hypothetical protein
MPYADKEKQKSYQRNYRKEERQLIKKLRNTPVSGLLKRGDKVQIINTTISGKEIIEGTATLEQKMMPQKYAEYWRVRFPDGSDALRWVRAENKLASNLTQEARSKE